MRYESDKALAFLPCVIENASINCPFSIFQKQSNPPVSYLYQNYEMMFLPKFHQHFP